MSRFPEGTLMIGEQVARVLKSAHPKYPEGSLACGKFGWATHTLIKPDEKDFKELFPLPDFKGQPVSYGLGILGMPGNTAYFGLLEICKPKEGETVVVTGAAGAVGSIVGQIAKLKGCKVIGFAGTQEKCDYLKKELGFDYAFNYKTDNIKESLKKAAPKGVDCYFDNVGGEISSQIISHMNLYGRISVCGSISTYNSKNLNLELAPILQPHMVFQQLKMEGFIVTRWADRWFEGINQNLKWIGEGKLKYTETVTEGFLNMPQAFFDMLNGKNTGKAIVKA